MANRRPKTDPVGINLLSLIRAGRALFLAALIAIPIGALVGLCAGLFFYGVGALYGAPVGVPFGFLAALFGAAIGRRHGWTIGGVVWGAVGGLAFMHLMAPSIDFCDGFLPIGLLVPAIAGGIAGWGIGDRLENIYIAPRGLVGWIDRLLYNSPLYSLPMIARLAIAVVEAAPLVAVMYEFRIF